MIVHVWKLDSELFSSSASLISHSVVDRRVDGRQQREKSQKCCSCAMPFYSADSVSDLSMSLDMLLNPSDLSAGNTAHSVLHFSFTF